MAENDEQDQDQDQDQGLCGEIKNSGEPCDYPSKYDDGRCGIHSDVNRDTQGRPTKFSDENARLAIAAARDEGKSKAGCERAAGVGDKTLDGWLEADPAFETVDGAEKSFSRAFAQARAEGESMYIDDGRRPEGDTSFAKYMLSSSFGYITTEGREHEHSGSIDREHTLGEDEQDAIRAALSPLNDSDSNTNIDASNE